MSKKYSLDPLFNIKPNEQIMVLETDQSKDLDLYFADYISFDIDNCNFTLNEKYYSIEASAAYEENEDNLIFYYLAKLANIVIAKPIALQGEWKLDEETIRNIEEDENFICWHLCF